MNNLEQNRIELLENKTIYPAEELLVLAQRDNNTKRKFLLVNRKQGKHLAAPPQEVLALFAQLGALLSERYSQRSVAIIGFAETATAIGALVAMQFATPVLLLQTSREHLSEKSLVDFCEEHSHATEQKLYGARHQAQLKAADVVIFVEDEVTTGKTILNFMQALRASDKVAPDVQFVMASLVNGLADGTLADFARQGICCHYLVRGAYQACLDPYPHLVGTPAWVAANNYWDNLSDVPLWQINGKMESRSGVDSRLYQLSCLALSQNVCKRLQETYGQLYGNVLVLGTEEFMYPAIVAAEEIQNHWPACQVVVHATTRSPIKISQEAFYPIQNGCRLDSVYEKGRVTYLYNLKAYDWAIWLTDADDLQNCGVRELNNALRHFGCLRIIGVRWYA